MCEAWLYGGLVFRLRCRMVFPPAAFFCLSGACSRCGAFSSVLPPFSPAVLCFVAAGRRSAACAVSGFLPSDISAEIVAAFFDGRLLPLQRTVFGAFQKAVFWLAKGGLLQPERIPFAR